MVFLEIIHHKKLTSTIDIMSIRILLLFALFQCLFTTAKADTYTVPEILEIAKKNSGNIQAAQSLALSQKDFAKQQKYWQNPSASLENKDGISSTSITQSVPFPTKLQKKYNIDDAEFNILTTKSSGISLLVEVEVFSLLYKHYGISQKIELLQKRLKRLDAVSSYLSSIALNSPTKRSQASIVRSKIILIKKDLIDLENLAFQTWNEMNTFLMMEDLPNIDIKWLAHGTRINVKNIIEQSIKHNLALKEQGQLIEKLKAELAFAKVENMPDFSVSINSSSNGAGGGIGVSLPIFNRNQKKISAIQKKITAQERLYIFEKTKLVNQVKNTVNSYEALHKISALFPTLLIKQILNELAVADLDFKKNILDFIVYIELDSREYEVIEATINTQVDIAQTYANLMLQSGNFTHPIYE